MASLKHRAIWRIPVVVAMGVGAILSATLAQADQRRVWDNKPLTLILPVGKEVRVTFPQDVQVQVPMGVSQNLTSLAPNEQMIYWTAKSTFDPARIIVTAKNGSTVYVLDVGAATLAEAEDLVIEDPSLLKAQAAAATAAHAQGQAAPAEMTANGQVVEEAEEPLRDPPEVMLTRFASQSLYAPSRLIPKDSRINQMSFTPIARDFPLMQSSQGERFTVEVVGAWAGFDRYLTAVLITNATPIRLQFDPSRVRGNFSHITAQHVNIGPKGSLDDRTTVYLVSEQPFAEALMEDSYAY